MNRPALKWFCALSLLFSISIVQALPDDKNKTAELLSDYADLNQSEHHAEFIGNVVFTQGSSKLFALRVSTDSTEDNKIKQVIAYGDNKNPAHFLTRTQPDKPVMHAYARTIYYYPTRHRIDLTGNARVIQGNNVLTADKIRYDTEKQRVLSRSDSNQRVTILINPEK